MEDHPSPPDNKHYFRPGASATRAQIAKIVYSAIIAGLDSGGPAISAGR